MAKRHTRSGKPAPGGRVTPKGVRPDGTSGKGDAGDHAPEHGFARPPRSDAPHSRPNARPTGPTRSGHHHGQR